jgi:CRP/FNR family cyclic AMP-dependent transcriptional regulator
MAVSIDLLKQFDILKPLPAEEIQALAAHASLRNIPRRGVVIHARQSGNPVCLLFSGRLQGVDFTLDGREVGLYFIEPGDFCGELGLFDEGGQPENVIALSSSQVVLVPSASFRQLLQSSTTLVEPLFQRMTGRIRQLSSQRALLGLPGTSSRVCGQLWMILQEQRLSSLLQGEDVIHHPPTHQELAIMLNLSRESVTRVFQTLQAKEVVRRDGNSRLLILAPEQLRAMAESSD